MMLRSALGGAHWSIRGPEHGNARVRIAPPAVTFGPEAMKMPFMSSSALSKPWLPCTVLTGPPVRASVQPSLATARTGAMRTLLL